MNETTHTGEHPKDVTVNEETKLPLKFVLSIIGVVVAGVMAWGAMTYRVEAQETRVDTLTKVVCAIAKKVDATVAECGF